MIVKHTQRNGVDRAVGQPVQGSAQIVEPVVGMDGRDNRHLNFPAQDSAGQVRARAVAVDDLKALGADHLRKTANGRLYGRFHDDRIDAELPRVFGKLSLAEADEPHLFRFPKTVQQRQHVRFAPPTSPPEIKCNTFISEPSFLNCHLFLAARYSK